MTQRTPQEIDEQWESLRASYYARGYSEVDFLKIMLALVNHGDLPTEINEMKLRVFSEAAK